MSLWCRIFGHDYDLGKPDHEMDCRRCGRYRFDYGECPECSHPNSVLVGTMGVVCLDCGEVLA